MRPEDFLSEEFWRSLGIEPVVVNPDNPEDWAKVKDAVVEAAEAIQEDSDSNPTASSQEHLHPGDCVE